LGIRVVAAAAKGFKSHLVPQSYLLRSIASGTILAMFIIYIDRDCYHLCQ
jgi:hypothetical protein